MTHPADETKYETFIHGWLPCIIGVGILLISICADLSHPGIHWTQRAGSIITVLGAYVAYRDLKKSIKLIDGNLLMSSELIYRPISFGLVVIGTIVWGYGDLMF